MSDRTVHKVSPELERGDFPKPFSAYLGCPNIVLLGDPGAGKSYLLRHFSAIEDSARLLRARDFLNLDVDALSASKVLFIDALDEKRAGRGDQNTIDAIVSKLCIVKPDQVRIACRAADWLGEILSTNTDMYKRFWNEDSHGRVKVPKGEESCRDVLVDLLRVRLQPQGVAVEPEGHMAKDKRADIVAMLPNMKLVIELKRDYHPEVWTAVQDQLDRFYTRDPEAKGFGIYIVFWYGSKRARSIPNPPGSMLTPRSPDEMQRQLQALIPVERSIKLRVVVLDVSGECRDSAGA